MMVLSSFMRIFKTNEQLCLIIDLMCGGDLLTSLLNDGCFTEIHAERLICQICEAVRYIHNRDIAHRDIKSENVLLSSGDRVTSGTHTRTHTRTHARTLIRPDCN